MSRIYTIFAATSLLAMTTLIIGLVPTADAECALSLTSCSGRCVVNLGGCTGTCIINGLGTCSGTCEVNTNFCWEDCTVNAGSCLGNCDINLGSCGAQGYCFYNDVTASCGTSYLSGPSQSCTYNGVMADCYGNCHINAPLSYCGAYDYCTVNVLGCRL